eukprot:1158782-Pelagomonas_calceolata.AAC.4
MPARCWHGHTGDLLLSSAYYRSVAGMSIPFSQVPDRGCTNPPRPSNKRSALRAASSSCKHVWALRSSAQKPTPLTGAAQGHWITWKEQDLCLGFNASNPKVPEHLNNWMRVPASLFGL